MKLIQSKDRIHPQQTPHQHWQLLSGAPHKPLAFRDHTPAAPKQWTLLLQKLSLMQLSLPLQLDLAASRRTFQG